MKLDDKYFGFGKASTRHYLSKDDNTHNYNHLIKEPSHFLFRLNIPGFVNKKLVLNLPLH